MISVLIPVYNTDVRQLANKLSSQSEGVSFACEIIFRDDASNEAIRRINAGISDLKNVRYLENQQNLGRIKNREQLRSDARYPWLLFLDDDCRIPSDQFLLNYRHQIGDQPQIFAGGRMYSPQPPSDCSLALHWIYGTQRESRWPQRRTAKGFQSNNFLIERSLLSEAVYPSGWQEYGHEDTWLGIGFERAGKTVVHFPNPVVHMKLETADRFLQKSEMALQNLLLMSKIIPRQILSEHVKLFRLHFLLKRTGAMWLVQLLYRLLHEKIHANLRSCSPSLFYFDLHRLCYFEKISR